MQAGQASVRSRRAGGAPEAAGSAGVIIGEEEVHALAGCPVSLEYPAHSEAHMTVVGGGTDEAAGSTGRAGASGLIESGHTEALAIQN